MSSHGAVPTPVRAGWHNPLRDKRDKRMPRIAGPCSLVIFGVTGDLSRKKLMPAIYDLANRGLLSPSFSLVGFARRDWADQDFGKIVHDAVQQHARTPFRQEVWDRLAEGFRFVQGSFDDDASFTRLAETLEKLDAERGTGGNHGFYLSIPPKAFPVVCEQLKRSGLADPQPGRWSRVVIEKPFGHDLASAVEPSRTSSRCVSPTNSTSRSGTATTSTACRSPWPRTSVWVAGRATTTGSARPVT